MSWYDFDEAEVLDCRCGWSGTSKEAGIEIFGECFAYECFRCGRSLAVFSYPTIEETKRKAAEGNTKALGELASACRRESFMERAKASEMRNPSQLPDLEGDVVVIEWGIIDPVSKDEDHWTVLEHEGQEIWREIAYYEGIDRFHEVVAILRDKYGTRLAEVRPTQASELYLFGDDMGAADSVKHLNQGLLRLHRDTDQRPT